LAHKGYSAECQARLAAHRRLRPAALVASIVGA
jgi:hypothetical protein